MTILGMTNCPGCGTVLTRENQMLEGGEPLPMPYLGDLWHPVCAACLLAWLQSGDGIYIHEDQLNYRVNLWLHADRHRN